MAKQYVVCPAAVAAACPWICITSQLTCQQVTAREYLETALRPVPGNTPSAQDKNQVRQSPAPMHMSLSTVTPWASHATLQHEAQPLHHQLQILLCGLRRSEPRLRLSSLIGTAFHSSGPCLMRRCLPSWRRLTPVPSGLSFSRYAIVQLPVARQ